MSIASAIQTKQQQVAAAYTACNGKGATMPATQDLTNLATCIGSIQTGGGGSSTWQVVEGIITNSNLDFLYIYNPNSEYTTSGNFIYLVFDNDTLLFATPAYKSHGTLIKTGVLVLVEGDYYARCYTQDEISIFDGYSFLEIQGENGINDAVIIEWTDPTV